MSAVDYDRIVRDDTSNGAGALFSFAKFDARGPNRYVSVHAYIFRHRGEPPTVLIQPSNQLDSVHSARKVARLIAVACEWIETKLAGEAVQP